MIGPCLSAALAGWLTLAGVRHPMHTSATELSALGRDSVQVTLRLFADDIGARVGVDRDGTVSGRSLHSYVSPRLVLVQRSGTAVYLVWEPPVKVDDMLELRGRGRVGGGLSGARVTNALLTDRFADQVNIVRATYAGRTATLLFTRGDGPKALP